MKSFTRVTVLIAAVVGIGLAGSTTAWAILITNGDFEDLTDWRVEGKEAVAAFERTREQQLWGQYVGKLTYRGTGPRSEVRILPPQPISISQGFDTVTLWCYGNNWGWTTEPATPRVNISALFVDAAGQQLLPQVRGGPDAVLQVVLVDDLLEALGHGFQIAAGQPTVRDKALGEDQQFIGLSNELPVPQQQ